MANRLCLFAIAISAVRINPEFETRDDGDMTIFQRRVGVPASTASPVDFETRLCTDVAYDQAEAHQHAMENALEVFFPLAAGWRGHHAVELEICPVQTFKKGFGSWTETKTLQSH